MVVLLLLLLPKLFLVKFMLYCSMLLRLQSLVLLPCSEVCWPLLVMRFDDLTTGFEVV